MFDPGYWDSGYWAPGYWVEADTGVELPVSVTVTGTLGRSTLAVRINVRADAPPPGGGGAGGTWRRSAPDFLKFVEPPARVGLRGRLSPVEAAIVIAARDPAVLPARAGFNGRLRPVRVRVEGRVSWALTVAQDDEEMLLWL